ncbi:MAG: hypothetical protein MUC68_03470 [Burkholderiaceae bacterium]|nr:hypothetical protein [Burkholderiaceae bacterium]
MDARTEQLLFDYENALNRDDLAAAVRCFVQPAVAVSDTRVFLLDTPEACGFHLGATLWTYQVGYLLADVDGERRILSCCSHDTPIMRGVAAPAV